MVKIILNRSEIDDAIRLADKTFARWKNRPGYYPNLYNSHLKGKFGEIAVEKLIIAKSLAHTSYFRDTKSQGLCDIELNCDHKTPRLEVKTWSFEHWVEQGRCVAPEQLPKLRSYSDAVIWCTIDLPPIKTASDVQDLKELQAQFMGWSTIRDIAKAPLRRTGWRKINNHQIAIADLKSAEEFISQVVNVPI